MRNRPLFNNLRYKLLPFVTVAVMMILWVVAAEIDGTELIFPKLSTTFGVLFREVKRSEFYISVGNTVLRSLLSFFIAYLSAAVFALLAAKSEVFRGLFYPVVVILRALPTISVIFICYIAIKSWFRAVLIGFLVIFPTLYSAFYSAFMQCSGALADVGKVYGVQKKIILTKFIIPTVWRDMFSDVVGILALTVKLTIAAEAITVTRKSLGNLLHVGQVNFDMSMIFAYTFAAIILGAFIEGAARLINKTVGGISLKCRQH